VSPSRHLRPTWVGAAIVSGLGAFGIVGPVLVLPSAASAGDAVGMTLCGLVLIGVAGREVVRLRRRRVPSPQSAITVSGRRPVLLLRSFDDDDRSLEGLLGRITARLSGNDSNFEQHLARQLRRVGPLVAIGRPGDAVVRLGATRTYVADDAWRDEFLRLVGLSRLFVWIAGTTPGVLWELEQLVSRISPRRLILALPYLGLSQAERRARWDRLREALAEKLPLPAEVGRALFVCFDESWSPRLVVPAAPLVERVANPLWPRIERGLESALEATESDPPRHPSWSRTLLAVVVWMPLTYGLIAGVTGVGGYAIAAVVRDAEGAVEWFVAALMGAVLGLVLTGMIREIRRQSG